jgi:ubiquinone/menaquinone biosynthesis C-methylase UbiE
VIQQAEHEFLIKATHDELNRQSYVSDLRMYLLNTIGRGLHDVYEHKVKPAFEAKHGRAPRNGDEVLQEMLSNTYCQTWSSMVCATQELLYDTIIPCVERAQPELNQRVKAVNDKPKLGSLNLDPTVKAPYYCTAVDVHRKPGSYHAEHAENDASQGALSDRGLFVYQGGAAGPYCDSNGRTMAEAIKARWPDFKPKKILDVGVAVGHNTLPYLDVFPDAELHAIDIAVPCLRYGHARAQALGKAVHFHQMDAEQTKFPDNSFDLVVSCILLHEVSRAGVKKILKECHRVLRPGGLTVHVEGPRVAELDPFYQFYYNWDGLYNNEPCLVAWGQTDFKAELEEAGFDGSTYLMMPVPDYNTTPREKFLEAVRSASGATKSRTAGHWGEEGLFLPLYCMWKKSN